MKNVFSLNSVFDWIKNPPEKKKEQFRYPQNIKIIAPWYQAKNKKKEVVDLQLS